MRSSNNYYLNNPLVHRNRRLGSQGSAWVRGFGCEDMRPLIICRGPIRREAMDVFEEMGITGFGILLSEKDSICLLYTSPSPRDRTRSRMPSSA